MPDINSLPSSNTPPPRSSPTSYHRPSPSHPTPTSFSRSPTSSNATGTVLPPQQPPVSSSTSSPYVGRSPHTERRRSSLLRDLNFGDGLGSGNYAASPNEHTSSHSISSTQNTNRSPSLGELHQELENEQEAQVNRLLSMIRQQQALIQQLPPSQAQTQQSGATNAASPSATASASTVAVVSGTPTPSSSLPSSTVPSRPQSLAMHQTPTSQPQHQNTSQSSSAAPAPTSASLSRQSSSSEHWERLRADSNSARRAPSQSPSMRPHDVDWTTLPGMGLGRDRDEVAFYQAETAMVQRENQMLKNRIRELERMVQALGTAHEDGADGGAGAVGQG